MTADGSPGGSDSSGGSTSDRHKSRRKIAVVGSPNVGKSVLFTKLTGHYVTVSNYPGTTVEVARGTARLGAESFEVIDTPGMYGLLPISEEEHVARRILFHDTPDVVLHVVSASALERMLPLTLQLREMGLPVVLVLNMMDEAERIGLEIDVDGLARRLGLSVVPTVATARRGLDALRSEILALAGPAVPRAAVAIDYDGDIEEAVGRVAEHLAEESRDQARGMALLLLQGDSRLTEELRQSCPAAVDAAAEAIASSRGDPLTYRIASHRHAAAQQIVARVSRLPTRAEGNGRQRLSDLLIRPVTGIPILAVVLYFGLYQFVGVFGAGTVVDYLESSLFGTYLIPWVESLMRATFPNEGGWHYWAREFVGGESGIVTLGITYAMAIVLPIVCLFFLFFSVLEDSGYFPRLAMLVDRTFKRIGLNGRAVIPMVLGFACDTMATMVTRIQETKRERIITTFLLALTVPCSAQYGVIIALLAGRQGGIIGISYAFLAWAVVVLLVFLVAGKVTSRIVAGATPGFYMELPPLRMPRVGNVLAKTMARMKWYFIEVLPLFVLASVLIWIGRITGAFELIISGVKPLVGMLGLPDEAAPAFLYGFFRRDFGAAGLFDLMQTGALNTAQCIVACVTLTLFLPCVAQLLIMVKERGLRTTAVMVTAVLVVAFAVGGSLNWFLGLVGVA